MEEAFKSFCAFGAGSKGCAMMDNAKFAKFSRDMKLLDKKLTATDVDIIFSKIKEKTERKINYKQFAEGLRLMAAKKYPGDGEGMAKIEELILSGRGPKTSSKATKAAKVEVIDRLTDASKYTGSHKERFDESGQGKGLHGRYDINEKAQEGYVGGYKGMNTYDSDK